MSLRKGTSIINIRAFVNTRFGSEAWSDFLARLAPLDRETVSSVISEGWYDMALHARINRAFCDHFYDGNLAGAEELGRFSAERDLAMSHRRILAIVRPSFAVRQIGTYWRQDEGSGAWTSQLLDNVLIARLTAWQGGDLVLCRRLAGYLARMLEVAGSVTFAEHVYERSGHAIDCTFRFGWQIDHDTPARERISSKAELWEVAREFGRFADIASLADAITELIHVQFAYPYVALWVRPVDSEGLTLVREGGARGSGTPVCSMLQRGGHVVGRLDVETAPVARQDLFEELVPLLALPLDAIRLSGVSGLQLDRESDFARRLLNARSRWQLTAKEGDVLELLMRGRAHKEIAEELGCKANTVEQHAIRILRKAEASSRSELAWKFWTEV